MRARLQTNFRRSHREFFLNQPSQQNVRKTPAKGCFNDGSRDYKFLLQRFNLLSKLKTCIKQNSPGFSKNHLLKNLPLKIRIFFKN